MRLRSGRSVSVERLLKETALSPSCLSSPSSPSFDLSPWVPYICSSSIKIPGVWDTPPIQTLESKDDGSLVQVPHTYYANLLGGSQDSRNPVVSSSFIRLGVKLGMSLGEINHQGIKPIQLFLSSVHPGLKEYSVEFNPTKWSLDVNLTKLEATLSSREALFGDLFLGMVEVLGPLCRFPLFCRGVMYSLILTPPCQIVCSNLWRNQKISFLIQIQVPLIPIITIPCWSQSIPGIPKRILISGGFNLCSRIVF